MSRKSHHISPGSDSFLLADFFSDQYRLHNRKTGARSHASAKIRVLPSTRFHIPKLLPGTGYPVVQSHLFHAIMSMAPLPPLTGIIVQHSTPVLNANSSDRSAQYIPSTSDRNGGRSKINDLDRICMPAKKLHRIFKIFKGHSFIQFPEYFRMNRFQTHGYLQFGFKHIPKPKHFSFTNRGWLSTITVSKPDTRSAIFS